MRVLLLLNRASGTGQGAENIEAIQKTLLDVLPQMTHTVQVVADHPAAKVAAHQYLIESEEPSAIVIAGGGGTLRAAVEGVSEGNKTLPGKDRIRFAPLRLGSGNVVAKQFGIPLNPQEAIHQIASALKDDTTAPCCVIRCDVPEATYYAVTMAGFGQFGRAPGDLVRWHKRLSRLRKVLARLIRLEKLNDIEYLTAMAIRTIGCIVSPSIAEMVEVRFQDHEQSFRLFSGVLLNFPIPVLPVKTNVQIEEKRLSLHLVGFKGRVSRREIQFQISEGEVLEMRFPDRKPVEFFLDEDPVFCNYSLQLRVAGTLAFVPGFDYLKK